MYVYIRMMDGNKNTRMMNGDNKNNGNNLLIIIRIILVTIYISVYNVYKYKVTCRSLIHYSISLDNVFAFMSLRFRDGTNVTNIINILIN